MGKKKKILLSYLLFALLFVFLVRIFSLPFTVLKEVALDLSLLPLKAFSLTFVPYRSVKAVWGSLGELARLKKENQSLLLRLVQLQDVVNQNKRLRELLSLKQELPFSVVAAQVIGVDVSNFKRTAMIDKGRTHGIKKGNAILSGKGIVGMVIEVGAVSSRIILINDPDFSIAAQDARSQVAGVVSGSLEETCLFKYITLEEDIRVGDEIVSRGRGSRFPSGIPIGEIFSVAKDRSGLTMFAVVRPYAKFSTTEEVLVILNN